MAASTILNLIFNARNNSSGTIQKINQDLQNQRNEIKRLQLEESKRAAQANVLAKLEKASTLQKLADRTKTKKAQDDAVAAQENLKRAISQSDIAQKKYSLGLAEINKNTDAVADSTDKAGGLFAALGGKAAIAGAAITAAIGAATIGIGGLANALQKASEAEVRQVNTANTIIRLLGTTRAEADRIVRGTIDEIIKQGQGQINTEFAVRISTSILDDVVTAVKQQGGDSSQVAPLTGELSARLASAVSGQEERYGELQNVLTDFLAGAQSIQQLQGRDILNDIGLNRTLLPILRERNITDVGQLSTGQRLDILLEALRINESDENIAARANTVKGTFGLFLNRLFNPDTGLFGVHRDLDEVQGNQSVFEAYKASVMALIGKNGVLDNAGRLLSTLGIEFDPLKVVRDGFIAFNEFLIDVNRFLIQANKVSEQLSEIFPPLQELGSTIAAVLRLILRFNNDPNLALLKRIIGTGSNSDSNSGPQSAVTERNVLDQALRFTNAGPLAPFAPIARLVFGRQSQPQNQVQQPAGKTVGDVSSSSSTQVTLPDSVLRQFGRSDNQVAQPSAKSVGTQSPSALPPEVLRQFGQNYSAVPTPQIPVSAATGPLQSSSIQIAPGAIVINQQPGQDAASLARLVLGEFDKQVGKELFALGGA